MTTSLWRTRPSLTCPRVLHNLRSPMWCARKGLGREECPPYTSPFAQKNQVFPARDKNAMRSRLSHVHHHLTAPHNTSATNLYNYTTRATLPPQTTTTNNRLTPENEVFAEPVTHLTRRRVSIRKGPASRRVRLYNFCPGAERARRARKLGHFHHTSQQQLGLALWPPSAFSKVVDGQGECLRFF